jgi:segregation and condensation protein B
MTDEALIQELPALSAAERDRLLALLEGALFASPEPVPLPQLARALGQSPSQVRSLLEELREQLAHRCRGLQVRFLAGGYQLSTKPEHHEALRAVLERLPPPAPLSRAALETVSIIALKQPVTAAEVQALRGVRNSDPIRTLLRRKLIAPAGRAPSRGHPLRYKTTQRFLVEFGLTSLAELRSAPELRHQPRSTPG